MTRLATLALRLADAASRWPELALPAVAWLVVRCVA